MQARKKSQNSVAFHLMPRTFLTLDESSGHTKTPSPEGRQVPRGKESHSLRLRPYQTEKGSPPFSSKISRGHPRMRFSASVKSELRDEAIAVAQLGWNSASAVASLAQDSSGLPRVAPRRGSDLDPAQER